MTGSNDTDRQAPQLLEASVHAEGFRQVREARRQELSEDYVELISDLVRANERTRQVDIAARLGVAQPTVAKMLKRLHQQGLVRLQPYRNVVLTAKGEALASASRGRHRLCEAFLLALGVSADVARRDAEGIEHHVSEETLAVFKKFLEARENGPPEDAGLHCNEASTDSCP